MHMKYPINITEWFDIRRHHSSRRHDWSIIKPPNIFTIPFLEKSLDLLTVHIEQKQKISCCLAIGSNSWKWTYCTIVSSVVMSSSTSTTHTSSCALVLALPTIGVCVVAISWELLAESALPPKPLSDFLPDSAPLTDLLPFYSNCEGVFCRMTLVVCDLVYLCGWSSIVVSEP